MALDFENIEIRVLLLGIYKKEKDETLLDVAKSMANNRVFSLKEGKRYIKELKNANYISEDSLTMIGIEQAKIVELEFKI